MSERTYQSGDILEGSIASIAFGGYGVMRLSDGFVVFIPFTAPGDRVKIILTKLKKRYAFGTLQEVLQPSPFRVVPKCPYFGVCGGCQLQHIEYQEQLKSKKENIVDAFHKFASIPLEHLNISPSEKQWAYRRHILLTLQPDAGHYNCGYIGEDNHTLIKIEQCPIFVSPDDPILSQVQETVRKLSNSESSEGRLKILKTPNGTYHLHFHFNEAPKNLFPVINEAKKNFGWEAIHYTSPKQSGTIGPEVIESFSAGLHIKYSSEAFTQNNPEESEKITSTLVQIVNETGAKYILDLYCGIGITALALGAKSRQVLGIEKSLDAIELARENAKLNNFDNVRFISAKVEKELDKVMAKQTYDLVIVNPPRIGLDPKVREILLDKRPKHLIYISCMPSTLARDLLPFCKEGGYRINRCEAFDMFPQTGHVEILAHLVTH